MRAAMGCLYVIVLLAGIDLIFEGLGVHLTIPLTVGIALIVAVLTDWHMAADHD